MGLRSVTMANPQFEPFKAKMEAEGLSESAIRAFEHSFMELVTGSAGSIPESSIEGVASLPDLVGDIRGTVTQNPALLSSTVVLKLNGGLGKSFDPNVLVLPCDPCDCALCVRALSRI